ncbi:MAG: ATP-binding protein [Bacteroidetes bacterium]|nr:ATP-binding protein [Bacteroidota bacterium]
MERTFSRSLDSLGDIVSFLKGAADTLSLDEKTRFAVNMAVEELFTNMIKYGIGGDDSIEVGLEKENSQLIIRLVDPNSEPFDLTDLQAVDTSAPLEERRPGGLGIHLVKCLMDEVRYEYKNKVTRIRLVKNL